MLRKGVSVRGSLSREPPPIQWKSGRNASDWNAFLFDRSWLKRGALQTRLLSVIFFFHFHAAFGQNCYLRLPPLRKILDPPLDWGTLKTIINTGHDRSVLPEEFHFLYEEGPCCLHKDTQNWIHHGGKYLLEVNRMVIFTVAVAVAVLFFLLLLLVVEVWLLLMMLSLLF